MTPPKIVKAARSRGKDSSTTASREVLLAALELAAEIVADRDMPSSARQRAIGSIATLTRELDAIDRAAKLETKPADGWRWGEGPLVAV